MTLIRVKPLSRLRAILLLEGRHQQIIQIAPPQMPRPFGRQNPNAPALHLQDRHIQRPPTHVKHQHPPLNVLSLRVINRRRRRLIHQPLHLHPRHLRSRNRALPRQLIEIRRHRDHHLPNLPDDLLAIPLQLRKNQRRNLRRRPLLAIDLQHMIRIIHVPLDLKNRPLRIPAIPRRTAHQFDILMRVKIHHRWRQPLPIRVRNNLRSAISFEVSQSGKSRSEINSNVLSHAPPSNRLPAPKSIP